MSALSGLERAVEAACSMLTTQEQELVSLHAWVDMQRDQISALEKERDRLRTALQWYADLSNPSMRRIAREALS